MDNRPIKYNPNGKYDLNFIDWQNEWSEIAEADYDGENAPEHSPIPGMTPQQFHRLMLEDSVAFQMEQDILEKDLMRIGFNVDKVKKMKVGKTDKDCSICMGGFTKGETIRVLKCKHIFHDGCIVPWFEKRSVCPNCRSDQK